MPVDDRNHPERIRALIEEVDRVQSESERVTDHLDRAMKRPFWPERRRSVRIPTSDSPNTRGDSTR